MFAEAPGSHREGGVGGGGFREVSSWGGLQGHGQECGFYSKCQGKPLEGFTLGSDNLICELPVTCRPQSRSYCNSPG